MKQENRQRDYVEGKSNDFEALDLHKDLEAWNKKENERILIYKKLAIKLRVGKVLEETKTATLIEHFKFDFNVAHEPDEEEIEELIDKFFKIKLENCQRDYVEGKSNGFEALEDLHKDLEAWNEKENKRILMCKVMHLGSNIPPEKRMEEQKLAIKLRVGEVLEETKSATLIEHFKFDLNVAPEPEKREKEIIDKFFKMKLENRQRDYVEGKSNGFKALEDLHKDLKAWNEKENKRILMYKVMHPGSEIL
ncbi:hypothetical protein H5410_018829 [Solanum commersonii]|uniref:Uncharacterized protein n=1 Tax=Solanum commersonii TaxID=4109 RepID=A0A9J6A360_SOLCO|nr:hypothetical protein H5410_018829 [Solanum commersonii]